MTDTAGIQRRGADACVAALTGRRVAGGGGRKVQRADGYAPQLEGKGCAGRGDSVGQ